MTLQLVTFGGLALQRDGVPIAGSAGRGRNLALLAILASAGHAGVPRERLAELLWAGSDPERARHSLDQALYTLRRALGPEAISPAGMSLVLDAGVVRSDVAELAAAERAGNWARIAELHAGPFAEGFAVGDAVELERWIEGERERWRRLWLAALDRLAADREAAGDAAGALDYRRRLAAAEPLDARAARQLMRALAAAGDAPSALRAAEVHAALVRAELEAEPDPSVLALAEEIRAGHGGRAAPLVASLPASAPPPLSPLAPAPALVASGAGAGARPPRRWRWAIAAGAFAVVLASALALRWHSARPAGADADRPPRVVVLPFEADPRDTALVMLGRVAADWVAQGLAQTGQLRVVDPRLQRDPSSSDAPPPPPNADATVGGRVWGGADSVHIHARVAGRDGVVLAALSPIAAARARPEPALAEVRERVVGALLERHDRRSRWYAATSVRPPLYAAHVEYVSGLSAVWDLTPNAWRRATMHFRRAAELDTAYVAARLWEAWFLQGDDGFARADSLVRWVENRRDALSPLERAWAARVRARLDGDSEASYRAARDMVRLAPSSGWVTSLVNGALAARRAREARDTLLTLSPDEVGEAATWYFSTLTQASHMLGEHRRERDAAEEAARRFPGRVVMLALAVPPLAALGDTAAIAATLAAIESTGRTGPLESARHLLVAAQELAAHGHPARQAADAALAAAQRARRERPNDLAARNLIAAALYQAGRTAEAWAVADTLARERPDVLPFVGLAAAAAARAGRRAEAARLDSALARMERRPFTFGEPHYWRATVAAALGDRTRALARLREAFARGGVQTWRAVHREPAFAALRDGPEVRALMDAAR